MVLLAANSSSDLADTYGLALKEWNAHCSMTAAEHRMLQFTSMSPSATVDDIDTRHRDLNVCSPLFQQALT
jgi:hypothetical protein